MDPTVDLTLRAGLALLFAGAAVHKARAPRAFREAVVAYRLLPAALGGAAAAALVAAEAGVAAALLAPGRRAAGLAGAAGLLGLYGAAIAVNLARGRRDLDCGCAGPGARRPISGWLVVRNAVLAATALAALAPVRARALVWVDGLTVVAALATAALLHAALGRLLAEAPARMGSDA
jgi:hypothetical protein